MGKARHAGLFHPLQQLLDQPSHTRALRNIRIQGESSPSVAGAQLPYSPHTVSRQASFTFAAGRQVYELIEPGGTTWIMQTYSQTVDPTLSLADLPGLAARLSLPPGWRYEARVPETAVVVDTTGQDASVTQDELANTYSLIG